MPSKRDAFFDENMARFEPQAWSFEELAKLEWFRRRWRLDAGMTVVEPGCGAGRLTALLTEWLGRNGRVIAFDPSEEMFAAHQRDIASPAVTCARADAESAALPKAVADRAICFRVFPHFEDAGAAIRNLATSLKPEGSLFVAHLHSRDELNGLHARVGGAVQEDRLPAELIMRRIFSDAGLTVNSIYDGDGRYHLEARIS